MSKLSLEDAMLHRSKHLEIIRNSHRTDPSRGLASVVLWLQKHTPQSGAENIAAAPTPGPANRRAGASSSDVLIDENGVSVGVHREKTRGAGRALVRLLHQLHALRLQLAL